MNFSCLYSWMCKTSLCSLVTWLTIFGLTSLTMSFLLLDQEFNTDPVDQWVLVGGVTAQSVILRIQIPKGSSNNDGGDTYPELYIATNAEYSNPHVAFSLLETNITSDDGGNSTSSIANVITSKSMYIGEDTEIIAVEIGNLLDQTQYFYALKEGDKFNNEGRFRTPAVEGTAFQFSILAAGCANTGSKREVFSQMAKEAQEDDVIMMLHLGDFHYEDIDTNDMKKRLDAVSKVMGSSTQALLFQSMTMAVMWDDHDWLGNNSGENFNEDKTSLESGANSTALEQYQITFPHYPLAGATNLSSSSTTILPVHPYHAFTLGTVRFIITDLLSERTADSIFSEDQKAWFFSELGQAANYDFVVWVTTKPWIGEAEAGEDSWLGYPSDRQEISNFITANVPNNLLAISSDAHMVAFDDGTNTYYGSDATGEALSFPILQTGPLDRRGSAKGGPYTDGCYSFELERANQYSKITFTFPENDEPCIDIESYRVGAEAFNKESKEVIFSKQLCGDLFKLSNAEVKEGSCEIDRAESLTQILTWASAGITVLSAIAAFFFVGWIAALVIFLSWIVTAALGIGMYFALGNKTFSLFPYSVLLAVQSIFVLIYTVLWSWSAKKERQPDRQSFGTKGANASPNANPQEEFKYTLPTIVRKSTWQSVDDTKKLPLGVILTGGKALREAGYVGKGIRVAVIDSGIDETHPGFKNQVIRKQWYRSGTPLSKDDHGTHVAGTIHMMAPQATIYDYRVFGSTGSLDVSEAIAQSIRDATDSDCKLINMSLGGPVSSPSIRSAVSYAASKGVIMVCAAGNEGDNNPLTNEISYPAFYDECVSIAAVAKRDGLPVAVFSNSNSQVDYAGIGVDVISFKPGGGFQSMSGTSMASPHVCGLFACLLQKYEGVADLRTVVNSAHVIDIAAEGFDTATGVGFLTFLDEEAFDKLLPRS